MASFCEDCEDSTPTSILGANASVFCQMVYYVYGETLQQVNKGIVQNIVLMLQIYIRARSKILQIKAEAWYVTHLDITVGNVSDRWVYVDKEDYCLLQETEVNLILEHGQEVLALDSVKSIPESFIREIISLALMKQDSGKKELEDPTRLLINELRFVTDNNGLDSDEPRNTLVEQLKTQEEIKEESEEKVKMKTKKRVKSLIGNSTII